MKLRVGLYTVEKKSLFFQTSPHECTGLWLPLTGDYWFCDLILVSHADSDPLPNSAGLNPFVRFTWGTGSQTRSQEWLVISLSGDGIQIPTGRSQTHGGVCVCAPPVSSPGVCVWAWAPPIFWHKHRRGLTRKYEWECKFLSCCPTCWSKSERGENTKLVGSIAFLSSSSRALPLTSGCRLRAHHQHRRCADTHTVETTARSLTYKSGGQIRT